ncbi:ABC transporter substrate-binding protein [soil metagenome]
MVRGKWWRLLAVLMVFGLLAAACGDDDDETADDDTTTTEDDSGSDPSEPAGDGLVIGRVLPESGPLAFLGPPMIEGTNLAIDDINAAGGVLGSDVTLLEGDEGADPAAARDTVTRLVNEGAQAIIGAAASGSSQEFIGELSAAGIPQCSGANTAPDFTDQANADFYFRTVPPDNAVAPIIANTVAADGATSPVVVARADDYGQGLGALVIEELTAVGLTVPALITYDPEATSFDAEVASITGANPDAVVLIAFDEGGQIVQGLLENGVEATQIYGSDGVFGPTFADQVNPDDPSVINGMKVIGAAGGEEFNARLTEEVDDGNLIYGGQTYDCVIITALAAEAAGSTEGQAIIDEVPGVTKDGTVCTSFEECKGLLEDGEDIDYDGASGALELDDVGDPTVGRYAIGEFQDGAIEIIDSQDVDLAELDG